VCSAPGLAGDALAAPTATHIGAVSVLSGATAGSALVLTDESAGLSRHEGVVAGVSAARAGFGASVSDAAPAPVCLAAGSASGSTSDAPLLFEIEALSLLEGATLGAVGPMSGAVQTAVQAAAPSAVRAAAAEIEKLSLLEGAVPAPFCSAAGSASGSASDAPTLREIESMAPLGAVTVLSGATAGSALVLTDESAGLSSHEGVVAGVSAASADFGASVSDAAPAPVCLAAGSASGSTSDAPLLFEIEALSLLEGATLGAVRLMSGAVHTAVQAAAPSAVRAAAAEIEKLSLLEGAVPAPICSAAGSASGSASDAPPLREIEKLSLLKGAMLGATRFVPEAVRIDCNAERAATAAAVLRSDGSTNALAAFAAVEEGVAVAVAAATAGFVASTTLNGTAPTPFCSVPDPAVDARDGIANALAAPAAIEIGAAAVLDNVTSGSAPMRTDASAGLCSQEGVIADVSAASAGFGASVSDAAPAPVCLAAGSASGSLSCPAPTPFDAAPAPVCSAAGSASGSLSCPAPTPLRSAPSSTGNVPLLLEIESLSLPLPLPLLLESLSLRATPAPVVAAVTATSADFGANTTLSGPAPARFCWVPDPAGDAPLMLEIEALSLLESAAPAPFCSAAGSASASAGDAPLPLEIEALSLLGGAMLGVVRPGSTSNAPLLLGIPSLSLLGAAWFVPDAVRVATPELNVCIAPGGPPPCHLLSIRVSTHRPAPRAPAGRRGRRAKRSTQSSWSWVMGAPAN